MEKNIKLDNVVPTVTLLDMEGYVVGFDGLKTTVLGQMAKGVVKMGRPANEASVVYTVGQCRAQVDASIGAIAAYDALTPDGTHSGTGTATFDGCFSKATVGTHHVRAIALEAKASGTGLIEVLLINA
jgi:hypothetical protein